MSTADGGFDFDAVLRADNPPAGGDAADNNTAGMFGGGIADLESQVAVTYLCGECGAADDDDDDAVSYDARRLCTIVKQQHVTHSIDDFCVGAGGEHLLQVKSLTGAAKIHLGLRRVEATEADLVRTLGVSGVAAERCMEVLTRDEGNSRRGRVNSDELVA
ncbi:hypothetical protein FOZ62_031102, partial [Perkinsus olseni]